MNYPALTTAPATGRALVVVNPSARGFCPERWKRLHQNLQNQNEDLDVLWTSRNGGGRMEFPGLTRGKYRRVYAVGGDGAISWLLNYGFNRQQVGVPLCPIPLGTANDLANHVIDEDRESKIDILKVNQQLFASTGGFGIPCDVACSVNRLRQTRIGKLFSKSMGRSIYSLAATALIVGQRQIGGSVTINYRGPDEPSWRTWEGDVYGVFCTNLPKVANSLLIAPNARANDGIFEICIMPRTNRARLLRHLLRLRNGHATPPQDHQIIRTREANIQLIEETGFYGDGEALCKGSTFNVSLLPRHLHVQP